MTHLNPNSEFRTEYIYLNTKQVRVLINRLKCKKEMTQKAISEKIGSSIGSVLARGSALKYESYQKLSELARKVNLTVDITQRKYVYNHSIASLQKLAKEIGLKKTGVAGKFLSKKYRGMNTSHKWQCGRCGKIWNTSPNSIMYQESWCTRCSGRETWTYEQMVELARVGGIEKTGVAGKFLMSKREYEQQTYPDRSKYQWECGKCGHRWESSANNIKRGSWCRECQYTHLSRTLRTPYHEIVKLAEKVGIMKTGYAGVFFASKEEYQKVQTPSHHKFMWQCGKCHEVFEMDITHVSRPQWCPSCTEGESEEVCRGFFEHIFKAKFQKGHPEWLVNPFSGGKMHLDGYNKRLKLAFEFNGPQHYKMYPKYHKKYQDFVKQQERDLFKATLCKEKDINLIVVPYWFDYDEFQEHIIEEYAKLTGNVLKKIPKYDWSKFKRQNSSLK